MGRTGGGAGLLQKLCEYIIDECKVLESFAQAALMLGVARLHWWSGFKYINHRSTSIAHRCFRPVSTEKGQLEL